MKNTEQHTVQQTRVLLYVCNHSTIEYAETGKDHRHFVRYIDGKRIYISEPEYYAIKDEMEFLEEFKNTSLRYNRIYNQLTNESVKYILAKKPRTRQ